VNQASKLKRELSAEISEESSLTAARLRVRNYFQEKHGSPELILVESGIGKVNFAVASTVLIQHLSCELLIFSGVAD
ncbi:MAG: hypothetical protein VXB67_17115, partial [Deltaproteobacteria bacterium]